jgi:hypothetical protein
MRPRVVVAFRAERKWRSEAVYREFVDFELAESCAPDVEAFYSEIRYRNRT